MNKIKKVLAKAMPVLTSVGVGLTLFAGHAFAAVDADISAAGGAMATSTKENLVGLVTGNINYIAIVFALSLGLLFLMKLFRRSAR